MPLRETVRIGHLIRTSAALDSLRERRYYAVTTRLIRRPATGRELIELRCDECGAALLLRVRSEALSRTIRKRYRLTTFIGAAVPLVLYGGAVGLNESGVDIPLSSVLGTTMVVAFLLVLAAFAVGWYAWYSEEPVRLHSGPGVAAGTHRLLLGGPDARRHPVSP